MEEDQQLIKHICKFCNKSFPCGRSFGGHMRSHVINSTVDQTDEKKLTKKLSNLKDVLIKCNENNGYVLRENPKKTCRFAHSNEDSLLQDKFCKQCGKGFHSWKALFGHMKCHSEKFSNSLEEDSWTTANQSDTETATPNRKKRSRRVTRYTSTTTNSSLSMANNNHNCSSSVSETDHQEQEEVALCLIMLSRDVGSKNSCLNSVDESSDNNFELLEAGSSIRSNRVTKNEWKNSSNGSDAVKFRKLRNGKLESTALDSDSNAKFDMKESDYDASTFSRNGSKESKLNNSELRDHGFLGNDMPKKSKVEDGSRFKVSEGERGKDLVKENGGLDQADQFSSKNPDLDDKKLRNGKLNKSRFQDDGFLANGKSKKYKVDDGSRFGPFEAEFSKYLMKENLQDEAEFSSKKHNLNPKKTRNGKLEPTILESNSQFDSACGFSGNFSKPNKSNFCGNEFLKNLKSKKHKVDGESRIFEASEVEPGKNLVKENGGLDQAEFSSKKHNLSKKHCRGLLINPELGSESRSKLECTTCNKAFHSYQALGGHRASHKRTKGCCFASKTKSSENSIETENMFPPNEEPIEEEAAKKSCVVSKNKNSKGAHECPICFKVFSSGQALGGHKRSHLICEAKSSNQTLVIQKPTSEIRGLLDLNLPAPVEAENSGNVGFKPWWVGSNPQPESLLGFLSNST